MSLVSFTNGVLGVVSLLAMAWMVVWLCWGATPTGYEFYKHHVGSVIASDPKGGLPLLVIAIPLLSTATLIGLLGRAVTTRSSPTTRLSAVGTVLQRLQTTCRPLWQCLGRFSGVGGRGDPHVGLAVLVQMLLPVVLYTFFIMYRHLYEDGVYKADMSHNDQVMEIANAFGFTAIAALSVYLLIPVTRQGPLTKLWLAVSRWNEPQFLAFHIWAGRLVVFGSLLHGVLHTYRYIVDKEYVSIMELFIVPRHNCWYATGQASRRWFRSLHEGHDHDDEDMDCHERWLHEGHHDNADEAADPCACRRFLHEGHDHADEDAKIQCEMPGCDPSDADCSCYHRFRNLVGLLAVIGLLIMLLSSMNWVRRNMYTKVFYTLHILTGPFVMLMIILHYNRSIVYMIGGIVYYLVNTLPIVLEAYSCRGNARVQIVSVERLPSASSTVLGTTRPSQHDVVVLTVAASEIAMNRFRPGQYVKLYAPNSSFKSHPFTINTVVNNGSNGVGMDHQLRIMFRVSGSFTQKLANELLLDGSKDAIRNASVQLDGYYGTPRRLEQAMQHDFIVFVAGGIGITPYLSLLHRLCEANSVHQRSTTNDAFCGRPRTIILRWVCRDSTLIRYVKEEYLNPLLSQQSQLSNCSIQIIIHGTGGALADLDNHKEDSMALGGRVHDDDDDEEVPSDPTMPAPVSTTGAPFSPSRFAPVAKSSLYHTVVLIGAPFALISLVGVAIAWYFYANKQEKETVLPRLWAPVAVFIFVLIASILRTCFCIQDEEPEVASAEWTRVKFTDEDELEMADVTTSTVGSDDDSPKSTSNQSDPLGDNESSIRLEESEGRPNPYEVVSVLSSADSPALFMCGPQSMMDQIRSAANGTCGACCMGHVATYEESFTF